MIIVHLMGGLGNQLFQYAAGRQLAERCQSELMLDTSWYANIPPGDTPRFYGLDLFCIQAKPAEAGQLTRLGGPDFSVGGRMMTLLRSGGRIRKQKFYGPAYDERFESLRDGAYLKGFFQSPRYFSGIGEMLRKELQFRDAGAYRKLELYPSIREGNSVCLHVRRGDYLEQPAHRVCGKEYYDIALGRMSEHAGADRTIYVFSDDQEWARDALPIPGAVFVDTSTSGLPHADLFLMASCRHHIIANSTYSWWGAWLGKGPGQTVIAPANWSGPGGQQARDICPDPGYCCKASLLPCNSCSRFL